MASISKAVERMHYYCIVASVGYDQGSRWDVWDGGETDCSALVVACLREAGFDTGDASYTGNMSANLTARGWKRLSPDLSTCRVGDILLNDGHHVAMVVAGSGWGATLAQASIDENGNTHGGRAGDQTGYETNERSVYSYPWNCILRYTGADDRAKKKEDDDLKQVINGGGDLHRMYNAAMGAHHFTTDAGEVANLKKNGWVDEGIACKMPRGGTVAIYRFYNVASGQHLLTKDYSEAQAVQKNGWTYEGVPFFAADKGTPVQRLYSKGLGEHLYTADANEIAALKKAGWKDEGVAWYAL